MNDRPIIGILTQPSSWPKLYPSEKYSYIATSYVTYLESAGARILPLKYDLPKESLKQQFELINGILIPGGGSELLKSYSLLKQNKIKISEENVKNVTNEFTNFAQAGQYLIQLARESNDRGDYFPVWGTCLGYELLLLSIANNSQIFNLYNSTNYSQRLEIEKDQINSSKLFKSMNSDLIDYLNSENTMYFNHKFGVDHQSFTTYPVLDEYFRILSKNHDKNGREFVSIIEGKKYPFYGVQFHPEKNAFEWKDHLEINHNPESIKVGQYFADFFVNEARLNFHKFNNTHQIKKELIYSFYPIQISESFMSVYIFQQAGQKDIYKSLLKQRKEDLLQIKLGLNQTNDKDQTNNNSMIFHKSLNKNPDNESNNAQQNQNTLNEFQILRENAGFLRKQIKGFEEKLEEISRKFQEKTEQGIIQ